MGKTSKEKEEGTRILNNYKKQLAEKMAREKAERGESLSNTAYSMKHNTTKSVGGGSSTKGGGAAKSDKKSTKSSKMAKRQAAAAEMSSMDSMEPEILLRILFGQGGVASGSNNAGGRKK